ncbi:hypothetical protein D6C83_07869, partial [Aureobasidium pullulans]
RLAEDRPAALRRNQKEYDLLRSADPASRPCGNITLCSPARVSLADRTRTPYGAGSEERRRSDDLAQRAVEKAQEAEDEVNRSRRREDEEPQAQCNGRLRRISHSDPPFFDPRSLSPSPPHSPAPNFPAGHAVSVVEVMLVFMCFRCTYHLDAGGMGKFIPPCRPHAIRMR